MDHSADARHSAIIFADLYPRQYGSAVEYLLELAREMWQRGVRPVAALCCLPAGPVEEKFRQARLDVVVVPEGWSWVRYWTIARVIWKYRPVSMHVQFYPVFSCLPVIAWLLGCKRTVFHDQISSAKTRRCWCLQAVRTLRNRLCCRFIGKILASSQFVAERLAESDGIPQNRIGLLYNGVNLDRFAPGRDGTAFRQEFGVGPCEFVVSFIGHLIPEKGVHYFLDAAAVLLQEGRSIRFLVVGTGRHEALLKRQARELGLEHAVIFTGARCDVENVLAATDIVVMPSQWPEAMGLVLLETMASGTPIVATRVGGIPEAVEDNLTGILVPPGQSEGIVTAVRRLLDDPALCRRMGELARRRAEQLFDIRRLAAEAADTCLSHQSLTRRHTMPSRASRFRARVYEAVEHRLQNVALRTGWNVARPTFVCAKLTRGCNSHCNHCNLWREGPYEDELRTEEWKGFFSQLRDWLGKVRVVITGGEALSRPDGLEIITHAAGCGLLVNLCSNGLAIDSTTAHKIMEADLDLVTVSLDGLRPEAHDYTRGTPGACSRVLEALECLRSARAERGASTRVAITTVVMQQTLDGLLDIVTWAAECGFLCRFQPIEQNYGEPLDPAWYKSSPRWIQNSESACNTIDRLIELRKSGAPIMTSQQDLEAMKVYFTRPQSVMQKVQAHEALDEARVCPAAVGNFVVEGNGDVRWCFQMPPAGNVKQDSPASIWRNRKRCWMEPCPWR